MDTTTEPQPPAEPQRPGLLQRGFALARRGWPLILCAYAINLLFALLAGVPYSRGLAPVLDHSLAAQRIAGTLDLNTLGELTLHGRDANFFPIVTGVAIWLNLLEVCTLFVLFAGTVFVFVSGESPSISLALRAGLAYFWRFLRAAILVGCVAAPVLFVLLVSREALLTWLDGRHTGRTMFLWAAFTGGLVFIVALLLRLWFDLVEACTVRAALAGNFRVHRSLLPAARLLFPPLLPYLWQFPSRRSGGHRARSPYVCFSGKRSPPMQSGLLPSWANWGCFFSSRAVFGNAGSRQLWCSPPRLPP